MLSSAFVACGSSDEPVGTGDVGSSASGTEEVSFYKDLPQMNWDATSQDLSPLLQKMALNSLFDITAKNWKIADQKLGVDAVAGKISIRLTPRQGEIGQQAKPENAAHSITFNKPFIWMISDLTTDAPAYYIGLVQNL